ncbi:hypothetical protein DKP76_13510 [Falsochrobactrum shanghaiense]|uniref:Restriction system protein Mrr-like N-terminal domain-containing protein n=1 Tax=Falsochrobactrum shanghaiense TaxID=2201899 RepID=A0A316J8D1_9HYPH|nr:hypothetical protein [Falsochrobactrum shanghaiense]PWL17049.1 hypothetical protein DKP76_13510 [Falsochrobactrum shanghaiense]
MALLHERQLITPTVELLDAQLDGFLTTSQLIDLLHDKLQPSGQDLDILRNRNDTHFSQKVRNLVCHRNNSTGLEARGLAVYIRIRKGWQITDHGKDYMKKLRDHKAA